MSEKRKIVYSSVLLRCPLYPRRQFVEDQESCCLKPSWHQMMVDPCGTSHKVGCSVWWIFVYHSVSDGIDWSQWYQELYQALKVAWIGKCTRRFRITNIPRLNCHTHTILGEHFWRYYRVNEAISFERIFPLRNIGRVFFIPAPCTPKFL